MQAKRIEFDFWIVRLLYSHFMGANVKMFPKLLPHEEKKQQNKQTCTVRQFIARWVSSVAANERGSNAARVFAVYPSPLMFFFLMYVCNAFKIDVNIAFAWTYIDETAGEPCVNSLFICFGVCTTHDDTVRSVRMNVNRCRTDFLHMHTHTIKIKIGIDIRFLTYKQTHTHVHLSCALCVSVSVYPFHSTSSFYFGLLWKHT